MYVVVCNVYTHMCVLHKLYILHTHAHKERKRGRGGKKSEKAFHLEIMGKSSAHLYTHRSMAEVRPSTNLSIKYPRIGLPPSTAGCFQEMMM